MVTQYDDDGAGDYKNERSGSSVQSLSMMIMVMMAVVIMVMMVIMMVMVMIMVMKVVVMMTMSVLGAVFNHSAWANMSFSSDRSNQ